VETVFKDWTIDKCIGEGASGKVYRITREDFGHTCEAALKVIEVPQTQSEVEAVRNAGMSEQNVTEYYQSVVKDIENEFALISKLEGNSNIVSYEEYSIKQKKDGFGWDIYIRMELLVPLTTYVMEHEMTAHDVIQIGIDICHALEICQKYNIVHRDIKLENIFVSDIGKYKLGDFGIAMQLNKNSSGLSRKGTFSYMAPEVYEGPDYDFTVDIYSLGVVLYYLLNGNCLPFMPTEPLPISYSDKEKTNIMQIKGQHMPKPKYADERLAEIVLKACAYNSSDRYESAAGMRQALEEIINFDLYNRLICLGGDTPEITKENTIDLFLNNREKTDTSLKDITDSQKPIENQNFPNEGATSGEFAVNTEASVKEAENVLSEREKEDQTAEKNLEGKVEEEKKKRLWLIFPAVGVVLIAIIVAAILGNHALKQGKEKPRIVTDVEADNRKKEEQPTSTPEEKQTIFVPDFVDLTEKEAKKQAEKYHLKIDTIAKYSDTIKKGNVIRQKPKKDSEVVLGSSISLIISKGAEKITVPKVIGKPLKDAKKILKKKKLKCKTKKEYSNYTAPGNVMKQDVKAGKKVKKGKVIILTVSKGKKPTPTATPYKDTSSNYQPQAPAATKKPVVTKKPASAQKPKKNDTIDWELVD